jgi:GT2 family glycosyltransferase
MKKVSVIILNYNGQKHLETYLPSVIKNTPLHLADIIVADNASTDNSVEWLKETYPAIKIIQLKSKNKKPLFVVFILLCKKDKIHNIINLNP